MLVLDPVQMSKKKKMILKLWLMNWVVKVENHRWLKITLGSFSNWCSLLIDSLLPFIWLAEGEITILSASIWKSASVQAVMVPRSPVELLGSCANIFFMDIVIPLGLCCRFQFFIASMSACKTSIAKPNFNKPKFDCIDKRSYGTLFLICWLG